MKLTPLQLAKHIDPKYQTPPHIRMLERFVMSIMATPGQAKGIIELPVRHGKSQFCSRWLPAWFLLNNPSKSVILTGYSGDFARSWGRKVRRIIQSHGQRLYGVTLADSRRQELWTTNHGGEMQTCGTHGAISGKGAHLLISDDQVRDQREANSPTMRDGLHSWFVADCLSRLEPDGKAVVILSRRNQDDLVGRLLAQSPEWRTLRLPALCDSPDDPLGRELDEPLWPERYDHATLSKLREELEHAGQSHVWECLYQQNPLGDPASREWPDQYFDGIWAPMPDEDKVRLRVLALDPSKGRDSKRSNYSAFVYLVLTHDGHCHVQSWLQRVDVAALGTMAARLISELKPDGFIYEGAFLTALFPDTHAHLYDSREDKAVRIRVGLTPLLAQRKLHLDPGSHGNRLLLAQLREFPHSGNDDGPDALTMAVTLASQLTTGKRRPQQLRLGV